MRSAVKYYERGEDMEAMDRFMDVLTKGDPAERSMANEYINLLTHRMYAVGAGEAGELPTLLPNTSATPKRPREQARESRMRHPALEVDESQTPSPDEALITPKGDKTLMRKDILARLRGAMEKSLSDLKSIEGVRVVLRGNGEPDAIGIPTNLLFQSGVTFQRGANQLLSPLTRLAFSLGGAQLMVLPAGIAGQETNVLDMRRTMGISTHLFNAGVAPARVKVNLINSQVDIPKAMVGFNGVVIVFVYNQPLHLAAENSMGDELGPPISLGVFPPAFRPSRKQAAIVEFSVSDPPDGLKSWSFQIMQLESEGNSAPPLQNYAGKGPVFHQIFWNGRRKYFGEPFAPGRYRCVLTATDGKNRQRTLHRWIQILGEGPGAARPAGQDVPASSHGAGPREGVSPPQMDMASDDRQPLVSGVKAANRDYAPALAAQDKARRQAASRPRRGDGAQEIEAAVSGAAVEQGPPWALAFKRDSYQLSAGDDALLERIAAYSALHPDEPLRLTGHSSDDEENSAALAGRRAKVVAGVLVNRFQVNAQSIITVSGGPGAGPKVDVEFVGNDE